MKTALTAILVFGTLGTLGTLGASAAPAPPICLRVQDIDNTDTPNGKTIIFHMKNGDVWRNTLQGVCNDLKFNGFEWTVRGGIDEVCEKQQSIRVLNSGEICILGKFDKLSSRSPKPG